MESQTKGSDGEDCCVTPVHALVVCDDPLTTDRILEVFPRDSFRAGAVEDVRSALRRSDDGPYDVLVATAELGNFDVWVLARLVHSGCFGRPAPCLVVVFDPGTPRVVESLAREYGALCVSTNAIDELTGVVARAMADPLMPALLLIDDDARAALTVRSALKGSYHVDVAVDGGRGVSVWAKRRHEIIILSQMLPDMSGARAMNQIFTMDPRQAVIVTMAHSSSDRCEEFILCGAGAVIRNPIVPRLLREICGRVLGRKRCESAYRQAVASTSQGERMTRAVWAARDELVRGHACAAAAHLSEALGERPQPILGDDEWAVMLAERRVVLPS